VIVRHAGDTLQLITQPDHARLAGEIMQHTIALANHPRRDSILLAITEHDNGWTEPDAAPMIDPATGFPLDFISAPITVRQGVWPRGIARLAYDPWTAGLVAQHAIAIFERYRSDNAWSQFFTVVESARQTMVGASGFSLDGLQADYRFLGFGDLISLTFCNGWSDAQQFGTWSVRLSGSQVVVSPDLFSGRSIPIAIAAKAIRRRPFRSDADLRDELAGAPVATLQAVLTSSPPWPAAVPAWHTASP
jgi:Protein of unknown function (DUF3891)